MPRNWLMIHERISETQFLGSGFLPDAVPKLTGLKQQHTGRCSLRSGAAEDKLVCPLEWVENQTTGHRDLLEDSLCFLKDGLIEYG